MSSTDDRSYADVAAVPPLNSASTAGPSASESSPAADNSQSILSSHPPPSSASAPSSQSTSPKAGLAQTKRVAVADTGPLSGSAAPEPVSLSGGAAASSSGSGAPHYPKRGPQQNDHHQPQPQPTDHPHRLPIPHDLHHTAQDLKALIKSFIFLPAFIRRFRTLIPEPVRVLARRAIRLLAMVLHKQGLMASNVAYDCCVFFWSAVISLFFREIRPRSAYKIPKEGDGGVLFVAGPHHNQFLDPLLLMSEIRRATGRRIAFITAAKSLQRAFVGLAARMMQSIPVDRAQDLAKSGQGKITISNEDPTLVIGDGTSFTALFKSPRCQVMLPRELGGVSAEVTEVIDDTHLRIKKEFNKKAAESLLGKPASYKMLPHVDQTKMYTSVYERLKQGGSVGIFPEGGSHDRTDLLPLKAGVSIMALGALSSNPESRLRIVPVGLSYFAPHRFRSRAVVEFGSPIEIPKEYVADFERGGEDKRKAIAATMDLVVHGLQAVTVRTPDHDTLMLIQAARRLYRPPGQQLSLGAVVELNKRFVAGYERYKDEPQVAQLTHDVKKYNTELRHLGLKDHQIEQVKRPLWRSLALLIYRTGLVTTWGTFALPGLILNGPIFVAAKWISIKKAKEALAASTVKLAGRDVLATWKVLVALAAAPALYTVYAIGAVILAFKLDLALKYKLLAPTAIFIGVPMTSYAALNFGEVGLDVYKSLRPLFLSVLPGSERQLDKLRAERVRLQAEIQEVVDKFGPTVFDDFQSNRIVPGAATGAGAEGPDGQAAPARPTVRRRRTFGSPDKLNLLTHPLNFMQVWLDEKLFGWSQTQAELERQREVNGYVSEGPSAFPSGYATDADEPDYDQVITILEAQKPGAEGQAGLTRRKPGRTKSQIDLTQVNERFEQNMAKDK